MAFQIVSAVAIDGEWIDVQACKDEAVLSVRHGSNRSTVRLPIKPYRTKDL